MEILIEEQKNTQQGNPNYWALMTDKQRARGAYYRDQYFLRRGEIDAKYKDEWDDLQKMYECRRDPDAIDPDYPNSFIPLVTPTIEGQIASMMESDIEFRHVTNNPAHQSYMPQLDAASTYYRKKNKFKQHFKDHGRYYDLLGNCWVNISWEKGYSKKKNQPSGCPKITTPPLLSVLVDGAIKDVKDLQYASYIIFERGYQHISWARKEFGEELADAICSGYNRQEGDNPDQSVDDNKTFMLLEVWTRDNEEGNLQLIRMDSNGLILEESDPSEPYYKNVDNQYPFAMSRMIPQLGCFYGFGDGILLKPMQKTVNNLVDELEISARFSAQARTYYDAGSQMDVEQITSDPSLPIMCKDPRNNILTVPAQGINPVVSQMIEFLLREAQKATRFHESMTGNQQGSSATATQINTQLSQGSVGIKDKKNDLCETMGWADMYSLALCMEYWKQGFWAAIGQNTSEWIDAEMMSNVPQAIPVTNATIDANASGENIDLLPFETALNDDGSLIMGELEFSTEVIIGETIPKGANDQYNIWLGLSQMTVLNKETQQMEPFVTPARLRQAFEEILGTKLQTESEAQGQSMTGGQVMNPEAMNQLNPIGNNANIQTPQATPSNLQQTVPQMPGGDSRSVQI